jgi:hypothetical protein
MTGLPRTVLTDPEGSFFRELPGDSRIDADTTILTRPDVCATLFSADRR